MAESFQIVYIFQAILKFNMLIINHMVQIGFYIFRFSFQTDTYSG